MSKNYFAIYKTASVYNDTQVFCFNSTNILKIIILASLKKCALKTCNKETEMACF